MALRRRPNLSWDTIAELQALVEPGTALASLFQTNQRALLFVVPPGRDAPSVCDVEIDRAGWLDVVDRFDREVRGCGPVLARPGTSGSSPCSEAALPVLEGVERVVLAPAVWGLQLPWATIARRAGWRTPDDRPLPIVTVESLGLLHRLLTRERAPTGGGVVVVGDPTGDLEHAEAEAEEIGAALGVEPILGAAATKEAVMAGLRSASMVHIAGHARFNVGAPLDSGIAVADGVITAPRRAVGTDPPRSARAVGL